MSVVKKMNPDLLFPKEVTQGYFHPHGLDGCLAASAHQAVDLIDIRGELEFIRLGIGRDAGKRLAVGGSDAQLHLFLDK